MQDALDYDELGVLTQGQNEPLPLASLGSIVADQLAGRVERAVKEFVADERRAVHGEGSMRAVPAWRYTLSQALKDKVLKNIADDALMATFQRLQGARGDPTSGPFLTSAPVLTRGGASRPASPSSSRAAAGLGGASGGTLPIGAAGLSAMHAEALRPHQSDGHELVGYLLRLPFSRMLLVAGEASAAQAEDDSLKLPLSDVQVCGYVHACV